MPDGLSEAIANFAESGTLALSKAIELSDQWGVSLKEVDRQALARGIWPRRYLRNRHTLEAEDQLKLLESRVLLVGCGGLGGYTAELLAREGVGELRLYDPDRFEESNLNRQAFCTLSTLGRHKAEVCAETLASINPAIEAHYRVERFSPDSDPENSPCLLIEAGDDPGSKRELAHWARERGIAYLHGAVAGESALFSLNDTLEGIYDDGASGAERWSGTLGSTAAFAASLLASQAIRLLTGRESALRGRRLWADLADLEWEWVG
jgi:molybdopterin/thiamine biosynthesis adenylyltransferase